MYLFVLCGVAPSRRLLSPARGSGEAERKRSLAKVSRDALGDRRPSAHALPSDRIFLAILLLSRRPVDGWAATETSNSHARAKLVDAFRRHAHAVTAVPQSNVAGRASISALPLMTSRPSLDHRSSDGLRPHKRQTFLASSF